MSSSTQPSTGRSADPRPARTRAAIIAAIQQINIEEQELTVSSIVAEAGIARSSFYSQFTDIGDVAVQLIKEVYGRMEILDAQLRNSGLGFTAAKDATGMLIDAMATHRNLYAAVLGANVTQDAHRKILRIMADGARPAVRSSPHEGIDEDAAVSFLAGGVLVMLTEWLLSPEPLSAEAMKSHIVHMLPAWIRIDSPATDHANNI